MSCICWGSHNFHLCVLVRLPLHMYHEGLERIHTQNTAKYIHSTTVLEHHMQLFNSRRLDLSLQRQQRLRPTLVKQPYCMLILRHLYIRYTISNSNCLLSKNNIYLNAHSKLVMGPSQDSASTSLWLGIFWPTRTRFC